MNTLSDITMKAQIAQPTAGVAEAVRHAVLRLPRGEPFPTTRLLGLGPRAAVDQALSRLAREGVVTRVRRGIYMRPRRSRLVGVVPANAEAVVRAIAESTGEVIAPHGAIAAHSLGLATQVPLRTVFRTSGRSRDVRVNKSVVALRHASQRQLALANTPAGTALAALRHLGKDAVTSRTLRHVRSRIGNQQFRALQQAAHVMPAWLSDLFWRTNEEFRAHKR
jgi:hypothetical protein